MTKRRYTDVPSRKFRSFFCFISAVQRDFNSRVSRFEVDKGTCFRAVHPVRSRRMQNIRSVLRSHEFRVVSCTNRPPLAPTFRIALGGDTGPRFRLPNPRVAGLVFDRGSRARQHVSSLGFRFGCLWRIFLDVVSFDRNSITAGPRFRLPNPGVAGLNLDGGSRKCKPVSSA